MTDVLEIQEMIVREEDERCIELLYILKECNKKAFIHMKGYGKTWKQKYRAMWKKPFWKDAKALLREYFTRKQGELICSVCKKPIRRGFTLHHTDFYNSLNYFTPLYVSLIHNNCHTKVHYHERKTDKTD